MTFRPPIPSLRKRKEVKRYRNEYAKPHAFRAVERINTAKKTKIRILTSQASHSAQCARKAD